MAILSTYPFFSLLQHAPIPSPAANIFVLADPSRAIARSITPPTICGKGSAGHDISTAKGYFDAGTLILARQGDSKIGGPLDVNEYILFPPLFGATAAPDVLHMCVRVCGWVHPILLRRQCGRLQQNLCQKEGEKIP